MFLCIFCNPSFFFFFYRNITCVINEYHSFEIGVMAEVVSKSLTVSPENIEFKMAISPFHPKFLSVEVHSYLNTPVSFSFMIPSDSPYMMEPLNGVSCKFAFHLEKLF